LSIQRRKEDDDHHYQSEKGNQSQVMTRRNNHLSPLFRAPFKRFSAAAILFTERAIIAERENRERREKIGILIFN
jgi:hypothetical protein